MLESGYERRQTAALSAPPCERRRLESVLHACGVLLTSLRQKQSRLRLRQTPDSFVITKRNITKKKQKKTTLHVTGGGSKAYTSGNFYSRSSFQINTCLFFFFAPDHWLCGTIALQNAASS